MVYLMRWRHLLRKLLSSTQARWPFPGFVQSISSTTGRTIAGIGRRVAPSFEAEPPLVGHRKVGANANTERLDWPASLS